MGNVEQISLDLANKIHHKEVILILGCLKSRVYLLSYGLLHLVNLAFL